MHMYGKYECFVMQMLYVCVLCASCGSSQCCVLHDLEFEAPEVSIGSVVLFIWSSRFLVYSTGSGMNSVQVVLSGFSVILFCFVQAKSLCI